MLKILVVVWAVLQVLWPAFCLTPLIACLLFVASVLSMLEMQVSKQLNSKQRTCQNGYAMLTCSRFFSRAKWESHPCVLCQELYMKEYLYTCLPFFLSIYLCFENHGSILVKDIRFYLPQRVQIRSGIYPASYPMDTTALSLPLKRSMCETDSSPHQIRR
jgi:hypothetical protein